MATMFGRQQTINEEEEEELGGQEVGNDEEEEEDESVIMVFHSKLIQFSLKCLKLKPDFGPIPAAVSDFEINGGVENGAKVVKSEQSVMASSTDEIVMLEDYGGTSRPSVLGKTCSTY